MKFYLLFYWAASSFYPNIHKECEQTVTTTSGIYAPRGKLCSGDLIFEENFDKFDLNLWRHELTLGGGSGNNQFQWYTNNRSNTYVQDGKLHVKPTFLADEMGESFLYNGTLDLTGGNLGGCTNPMYDGCKRTGTPEVILNPIKSARMNTAGSFSFRYGRVETRVKVPVGDWLWPAVWMKPRWNLYSTWPASGEIDLVETRGNRKFIKDDVNIGVEQVACTLHWGPNSKYNRYNLTSFTKQNEEGWHEDYHLYQLEWTPTYISYFIDDEFLGIVEPPEGGFWELGNLNETGLENPWKDGTRMAPFDDEFYFLINMAIGSTSFFTDQATNYPYEKPWKNWRGRAAMTDFWKAKDLWWPTWGFDGEDSIFKVDYIKVWAL